LSSSPIVYSQVEYYYKYYRPRPVSGVTLHTTTQIADGRAFFLLCLSMVSRFRLPCIFRVLETAGMDGFYAATVWISLHADTHSAFSP
jgi:hypothetical protein